MGKLQFLYQLKLIPSLLDEDNWTDKEHNIVQEHFEVLQSLEKEGKLIMAGRTLDTDPLGLVILEVDTEDEAIELMENDPAVKEGIMEAKLSPYRLAILRK
ncbi:YciI family protein [Bacillus sp. DTU_2020_1000418_1_SI_GHA_SEK_038]|uniref:YciI family protein n=1 Tax=Bacillus sp. DTU_2020_1000418_1_SI_GHA_SEK_038 TaxID=3077585 RepID=UPI0028EB22A4|nr:YciI family protein [Bacillus sp. DTU_2020_1000418_1_SI_GHA_SEK_038]WNS75377.1 YciI family protein [Bacillus sp. DTU_2020_1000418_1_SI_GHA_SEK_038]